MQALLFAALLAQARAHVDGDGFFAPVAGTLLGLLLFLRFDAVLGIAAVLAALALGVVAERARVRVSFFVAFAVTAALAGAYLVGPMRHYADLPIVFLSHFAWWQYALLAAGAAAGIGALALGTRLPALGHRVRTVAPTLLAFAVVGTAVYALLLRAARARAARAARRLLAANVYQFLPYGPRPAGGAPGYALLARRVFWRAPELFTTVALFSSSSSTRSASSPITSGWRGGFFRSSFPAPCCLLRPLP